MLPICCTLSKGSVQQEKASNCSKSFASRHQTRRRSGYPIHATAQVALIAPFSLPSPHQKGLAPVAQAADTLAVVGRRVPVDTLVEAVAGRRAGLPPAAAGDPQSARSAEHPSGLAAPISWPCDGPLHRPLRLPRRFLLPHDLRLAFLPFFSLS